MQDASNTASSASDKSQLASGFRRAFSVARIVVQCCLIILSIACLPAFFYVGREFVDSGLMFGGPGIGGIGVVYLAVVALLPGVVGVLASISALAISLVSDRSWNWIRIATSTVVIVWAVTLFALACFLIGAMR